MPERTSVTEGLRVSVFFPLNNHFSTLDFQQIIPMIDDLFLFTLILFLSVSNVLIAIQINAFLMIFILITDHDFNPFLK